MNATDGSTGLTPLRDVAEHCSQCGNVLARGQKIDFWDGSAFCPACVRAVWPPLELAARSRGHLDDRIKLKATSVLNLVRVCLAECVAGVLLAAVGSLAIAAVVRALGFDGAWQLVLGALLFGICGSLLYVWNAYVVARKRLPRTVLLMGGKLTVRAGSIRSTCHCRDCTWYLGPVGADSLIGSLLGDELSVLIQLPDRTVVACGAAPNAIREWIGLMILAGVRVAKPHTLALGSGTQLVSILGCALIGVGSGYLAEWVTGWPDWVLIGAMLGLCDGIFLAFSRSIWLKADTKATWRIAASVGMQFCFFAFVAGFRRRAFGWEPTWGLAAAGINGVFGSVIALLLRRWSEARARAEIAKVRAKALRILSEGP